MGGFCSQRWPTTCCRCCCCRVHFPGLLAVALLLMLTATMMAVVVLPVLVMVVLQSGKWVGCRQASQHVPAPAAHCCHLPCWHALQHVPGPAAHCCCMLTRGGGGRLALDVEVYHCNCCCPQHAPPMTPPLHVPAPSNLPWPSVAARAVCPCCSLRCCSHPPNHHFYCCQHRRCCSLHLTDSPPRLTTSHSRQHPHLHARWP
mmetsp:Transcript_10889/g.29876  ORF Transcript_10889/g.29876 Transcript_10889/m.29876 type:complete len:202 (-) Transcript_10889:847-1452(-)